MARTNVKKATATVNPTVEELASTVMTEEQIDKELEEILKEESHAITPKTDIDGMTITEVKKTKTKKQPKPKPSTDEPKVINTNIENYNGKKPIEITADTSLVAPLPDVVTVKDLVGLFSDKFDGKFIRRHIRNKFIIAGIRYQSDDSSAKYTWSKDDPMLAQIVTYLKGLA